MQLLVEVRRWLVGFSLWLIYAGGYGLSVQDYNSHRAVGSIYFVATDFNPLSRSMYFLSTVGTAHLI